MSGNLVVFLVALTMSSLVMVVAMVGFTGALVALQPSRTARWFWWWLYAASWTAIVSVMAYLPPGPGEAVVPRAVFVIAPAGWGTFNAFWIRASVAIGRATEGGRRKLPPDADLLARRAAAVFQGGGTLLLLALWDLGAPQRLVATMIQPNHRVPAIAIAVGVAGFALFMMGAVRLVLGVGRPTKREDTTPFHPATGVGVLPWAGPALYRTSKSKLFGSAQNAGGQMEFTFDEMREAWRTGRWRRDPEFLTAFMMLFGVAGAVGGGLASGLILGSTSTRVVLGGMFAYAVVMAALGRRRGKKARRRDA